MNLRKILSMVLILVLALGTFSTASAQQKGAEDLRTDHWAYGAMKKMVTLGIMEGYEDGSYRPDTAVNREQFAKMMVSSLSLELQKPAQPTFSDVPKQYWAYSYVETAKPYLTGYQSGDSLRFKPSESAVREDMAVALVRALGYGNASVDEDVLDRFADAEDISKNIRKYVAIAVSKNLMKGSKKGDDLYFKAQATLTRAEAAVLLTNVIEEEKIVFDGEDKVVIEPVDPPAPTEANDEVSVTGTVKDGKVTLHWEHDAQAGLQGFKVVASLENAHPKYPQDGYMFWITDLDTRSKAFSTTAAYNGGDIGGKLRTGKTYYFSVTAVYGDEKIAGNAVKLTLPAEAAEDADYPVPQLSGKVSGSEVELEWDEINDARFQGYKVVISSTNAHPAYPADGYYKYITDKDNTEVSVEAGDAFSNGSGTEELESGKSYYFSITALYDGKKVPGNTIRLTLP